ncbi:DUF4268 domain-containing protein [Alkaliphilus serpentinus]|uniref:DUF4268 domain-containing protein n=1 Tax=Alkaliphilus serpentinus TaxID=1482731 RepID=A0A833HLF5_9FIRM|nr:DUF4268 domain-containing protein [Alkaliphilus serpentinus]KAB3525727.1 DUF4268 domain-containing protein [Alkaliphilus serpentinus]
MLGKLEKADDLRTIWKHEAHDFTKWLSKNENLTLLGDEIGIEINLLETEASVGCFSVDILAEEENTGRKIIIENQLETTDHDHLGKVITYASGYDAEIIIWVVKDIREEHRQAIDWLNEHTDEKLNFFIAKLELWKIGDSPCAVKFQVISRPNDWAKSIRQTTATVNLTDTKVLQLEFWNEFKRFTSSKGTTLKLRKAQPQHWYDMTYGVAGSHISLTINTQQKLLGCEIYISDSKELYYTFEQYKEQIEEELGLELEWMELPNKKASRIKAATVADINNRSKWESNFEWLKVTAEKFQKIFYKYGNN